MRKTKNELSRERLKEKFDQYWTSNDVDGKSYIDDEKFFKGDNKIHPDDFIQWMHVYPPITFPGRPLVNENQTFKEKLFTFRLPIGQTIAFWLLFSAGIGFLSCDEQVKLDPIRQFWIPIIAGALAWLPIESGYHAVGHIEPRDSNLLGKYLGISADQQMQFVYHLHWDHHGRPDLKGDTVSPLFKNLILACVFYLVFYMAQSPNPVLSMSALMAMYAFYEYTHWLSHADVATRTFASRMPLGIGWAHHKIIAHHRSHHETGGRLPVSTGPMLGDLYHLFTAFRLDESKLTSDKHKEVIDDKVTINRLDK